MSPVWSPDGKIAYVSFEKKNQIIYVATLATGTRITLSDYKGSNSAPAWSLDGRRLALTLTKDGLRRNLYREYDGTGLRRLMSSNGIDTEPRHAPDGEQIYFTRIAAAARRSRSRSGLMATILNAWLPQARTMESAHFAGWQDADLCFAQRRHSGHHAGSGHPAGAGINRFAARRITQLCP